MTLVIELDQEDDGRWIAEVSSDTVPHFPDILIYGATREEAIALAEAAALRALADLVEAMGPDIPTSVSFAIAA